MTSLFPYHYFKGKLFILNLTRQRKPGPILFSAWEDLLLKQYQVSKAAKFNSQLELFSPHQSFTV